MYPHPVSIEDFEWSRLGADGVTNMGEAFKELSLRMSRNSYLNSPSLSFAPVIFLMTDGYPSDDYKAGLKALKANSWYKFGLKAALGIGSEANDTMLAEFTGTPDTVVHAYSGGQLAQMIKIVAVTASQIGSKSMTLTAEHGLSLLCGLIAKGTAERSCWFLIGQVRILLNNEQPGAYIQAAQTSRSLFNYQPISKGT